LRHAAKLGAKSARPVSGGGVFERPQIAIPPAALNALACSGDNGVQRGWHTDV
jgi:hypothetical protein